MAIADGLVRAVAWVWELDFVTQLFFAIWHAVSEDDAHEFVEVVAAFSCAADVDVDEVTQRWTFIRVFGITECGFGSVGAQVCSRGQRHVDYRAC